MTIQQQKISIPGVGGPFVETIRAFDDADQVRIVELTHAPEFEPQHRPTARLSIIKLLTLAAGLLIGVEANL